MLLLNIHIAFVLHFRTSCRNLLFESACEWVYVPCCIVHISDRCRNRIILHMCSKRQNLSVGTLTSMSHMLVVWCDHYGNENCLQSVSVSGILFLGNEVYAPSHISTDDYLVSMALHIQNRRPNHKCLDKRNLASRAQCRSCRCYMLEVCFIYHYRFRPLCLWFSFCIQPIWTVSHRLDNE